MKLITKKNQQNLILSLGLCILLISGVVILTSCRGKELKPTEEPAQEIEEPQVKVEELQKALTEKEETINHLKEENTSLKSQIPESYYVQKGDNHWTIAFNYLTQKQGLPAEEAMRIMADVTLFNPILVGFKVWNYFYNKTYGTFLTQGNATVSPVKLMVIEKEKKKQERLELESAIMRLNDQNEGIAKKMEQMKREHTSVTAQLNDQIASLKQSLNKAQSQSQDLEAKLNSVYYLAGSKDSLKDNGNIKGTFLGICGTRIKDITSTDFQNRIDLREKDNIDLEASDFDLSQIKKVRLLPKYMEEGKDYRVEIAGDRRSASVILLNKEKFRLARLIIFLK